MLPYRGSLFSWLEPSFRKHLSDLRDVVIEEDDPHELWQDVLALAFVLFFSGQQGKALERYFDIIALELVLHFAPRKPRNYPWIPLPTEKPEAARFDITKLEFFQLDDWTNTDRIPSTDYRQRESFVPIDENDDASAWQTSRDPWTHAICARLLGREPGREAIEEAFAAADKLFTKLPRRKNPADAEHEWPHSHIFPTKVYFLLAVGLGKRWTAREILRPAVRRDDFVLHGLLMIPATYEVFLDPELQDIALQRLITEENTKVALSTLNQAFKKRRDGGQQEPLQGLEWPELLRRFSEAAFKLHSNDFESADEVIEKPSDILLPPLTSKVLAEFEEQLGPLPQDVKDMAVVANGFKRGWHFAGGGWGGVDALGFENPAEYEIHLGIQPPSEKFVETITNPDGTTRQVIKHVTSFPNKGSGVEWGPVYAC